MASQRILHATDDGRIDGLRVIGFHGVVDPGFTPAQCEPILVDDTFRLTRIVHIDMGADGLEFHTQTIGPPLPVEGALPGVATRFGLFPAIIDGVVAVVGRSERGIVQGIDLGRPGIPRRVVEFLTWLRDDERPSDLPCGEPGEGLWACYLTKLERHALWKAFNPAVYLSLREAVRAGDPEKIAFAAFWLARVVVDARSDLFKAAEALRRAGSPRYRYILQERLGLKDEATWEEGLADAAYAFDRLPDTQTAPPPWHYSRAREDVRHEATQPCL